MDVSTLCVCKCVDVGECVGECEIMSFERHRLVFVMIHWEAVRPMLSLPNCGFRVRRGGVPRSTLRVFPTSCKVLRVSLHTAGVQISCWHPAEPS